MTKAHHVDKDDVRHRLAHLFTDMPENSRAFELANVIDKIATDGGVTEESLQHLDVVMQDYVRGYVRSLQQ